MVLLIECCQGPFHSPTYSIIDYEIFCISSSFHCGEDALLKGRQEMEIDGKYLENGQTKV